MSRRALVVLQCTNLGGMEIATAAQMKELSAQGWAFDVISTRPWGEGQALFTAFDSGAEAYDYRGRFGWRTYPQLSEAIVRRSEQSTVTWLIGTALGALRAGRHQAMPVVLSHHYHHLERKGDWVRWRLFYELCRGVRAITFPTEFTRAEAVDIAPWISPRSHVVPYGFEVAYVSEVQRLADQVIARRALGIAPDAFVIGNAGWLIPRKRFDVFLRTAACIARRIPEARFEVCGIGPLANELQRMARALGISEKVTFRGLVSDMATAYRAWDVCLFNSDFDTLPTTPLQAASFGCVVVASLTYGGLSECFQDGHNGVLLASHDVEGLCESVARLAHDDALGLAWRTAARATLAARHDPTGCAKLLSKVLQT